VIVTVTYDNFECFRNRESEIKDTKCNCSNVTKNKINKIQIIITTSPHCKCITAWFFFMMEVFDEFMNTHSLMHIFKTDLIIFHFSIFIYRYLISLFFVANINKNYEIYLFTNVLEIISLLF
jgi:hypothetical protein